MRACEHLFHSLFLTHARPMGVSATERPIVHGAGPVANLPARFIRRRIRVAHEQPLSGRYARRLEAKRTLSWPT